LGPTRPITHDPLLVDRYTLVAMSLV
jgi:hypothetical protein